MTIVHIHSSTVGLRDRRGEAELGAEEVECCDDRTVGLKGRGEFSSVSVGMRKDFRNGLLR